MVKYRSLLEIRAEILGIAEGGEKITHIMQQANLSYNLLKRYLDDLSNSGMLHIERKSKKGVYCETTRKGSKYREMILEHLERVKKIPQMEKELKELENELLSYLQKKND